MELILTELKALSEESFLAEFSDEVSLKITAAAVVSFSLYSGKEMTQSERLELMEAAGLSLCKGRALRILGTRSMSRKELYDRLLRKGESPENSQECVRWLTELGYLDDKQYAGEIVRHYAAKGYGIYKIKSELQRRGIDRELWDEAVGEMPVDEDMVYELLMKKLQTIEPDRKELKKATDYLHRRGFSWDEIKMAMNKLKGC